MARLEGILSKIACGAALAAIAWIGKSHANDGKTIVVLLPDTGERSLATILFKESNQTSHL